MMVLTAFHMLSFVDNASGEDVSVGSAVDRPTTHSQRRLTISNIGAKEPSSMTDSDGNLYLAWVDITEHGEVLCWKRSSDNARSFTSDKAISSEFLSIRNISMTFIEATDEVVIAFEGKMDETGPFMVYLLMSQNGQRSWSQLYALGEGAGPTVLAIDRDLFISLTSLEQGRNVLSIIKASIIDSRLQGATSIISFPIDAKVGEMVSLGDRIHYASFVRDGTDTFVYGQIDRLGNRLIGPSAVLKTGMEINEFVLMDDQGVPTLVWLGKEYERTYLKTASMKGDIWGSISETPLVGMAHDLVSASSENGKYISWISSDGEMDNVFGARKDGSSTNEQSRISSPGFNASKPTISLGPEGSFNLIWSEDTGNSTELYICADASYDIPNIYRLNQWLSEQSVDAFMNGDEGRQALISNISSIIQNISTDNLVESTEKIWEVENNIDHYIIGLSVLNAGSDTMSKALSVKAKLKANLESARTGIANGGNADSLLSSESMDGGSPESYIYDVLVTLLSPTSVKISWSTSFYAVHNRISIGATSPYDTEYDVSGNGYEHERTIDVQSNTEYQFFVKSCELYLLVLHTPYSSSVMSFKTNVTILNVAGSSELFSIQLSWQTTVSSSCTIQLNAPDQPVLSGSVSSDSSRTHHSATFDGLTSDTVYHYVIRANWTGMSSAIFFDMCEGAIETIGFAIYGLNVTSGLADVTFEDFIDFRWNTNRISTAEVFYGQSPNQLNSTVSGSSGTNHSLRLSGVIGGMTYYYRVVSTSLSDASESANVSGTIATSRIYGLRVQIDTPQSVTISWYSSGSSATNRLRFGINSIEENVMSASGKENYHYKTIIVNPQTQYKFLVESVISGTTYTSGERTFETNVTIADVRIDAGPHSFMIQWRTNVDAACQFSYGPTTASVPARPWYPSTVSRMP